MALLAAPAPAAGQDPGRPAEGSRVRITVDTGGTAPARLTGTLMRLTPDSLILGDGGPVRLLSRRQVQRLELSQGVRSRKGTGLAIGIVAGAVGGLVGLAALCGPDRCIGSFILVPIAAVGGGIVGGGIGWGIGALTRSERWRTVPPAEWGVGRRVPVGIRVAF